MTQTTAISESVFMINRTFLGLNHSVFLSHLTLMGSFSVYSNFGSENDAQLLIKNKKKLFKGIFQQVGSFRDTGFHFKVNLVLAPIQECPMCSHLSFYGSISISPSTPLFKEDRKLLSIDLPTLFLHSVYEGMEMFLRFIQF